MNSLFKKFLFYNLIGLGLIATIVFSTLQLSQKNLVDERIQEIKNHALLVDKYLTLSDYSENILDSLQDFRVIKEINSILENKNISIIILDKYNKILFDSKGYDLNEDAFQSKSYVTLGDVEQSSIETNRKIEILGRTFINKDAFKLKFTEAVNGTDQNFIIKSNDTFQKGQIEIISIRLFSNYNQDIYIVAYEDNRDIQKVIDDNRTSILIGAIPIMLILLLFSIFLSSVVISPIKQLADSAKNIQTKRGSTSKIINLNKRKDEIGDLSKILAEKVESLKDKIEENEEYSADLMHEIRNPLTSIKMATEVMSNGETSSQGKFIAAIQNDVARIEAIITDYSIMMKDEASMSGLRNDKIDIQNLLENIILEYSDINNKNLDLKLIKSDNIRSNIFVNGHEEFIKRALHNIYDNAISFSPRDSVIETSISLASSYLTITISDNGPGIEELNTENIFNRFYTLRESSEDKTSTHSGLGLHIARQIIEAHKGNIRAENKIMSGKQYGAKFIVNLPIITKIKY